MDEASRTSDLVTYAGWSRGALKEEGARPTIIKWRNCDRARFGRTTPTIVFPSPLCS
jgi:hypothetical protein